MYSQYIEGQSLLHKMPVSVKLIVLVLLILSGFMLHSLVFALIFFLCAIALIFVAGISGAIAQHFLQIYMNPILLALTSEHSSMVKKTH